VQALPATHVVPPAALPLVIAGIAGAALLVVRRK
jgi:hypothetical protein